MKKIGIMGGTFNPIHYGHLHIAENAFKEFGLDEVLFMPNNTPGYKDNSTLAEASDRVRMIEMAISNYSHFSLNTMEIDRGGVTYTIDTLNTLTSDHPGDKFYFIIGADSLENFLNWREPKKILEHAYILVATRGKVSVEEVVDKINKIEAELEITGRIMPMHCSKLFDISLHDYSNKPEIGMIQTGLISSEKIRTCFATRKKTVAGMLQIKDVIPKDVFQYIKEHKLY